MDPVQPFFKAWKFLAQSPSEAARYEHNKTIQRFVKTELCYFRPEHVPFLRKFQDKLHGNLKERVKSAADSLQASKNLISLPPEIQEAIFSKLAARDQLAVARTCRAAAEVISLPELYAQLVQEGSVYRTVDQLLAHLDVCGPLVKELDFSRFFRLEKYYDTLFPIEKVLGKCPNLEKLTLADMGRVSQLFKPLYKAIVEGKLREIQVASLEDYDVLEDKDPQGRTLVSIPDEYWHSEEEGSSDFCSPNVTVKLLPRMPYGLLNSDILQMPFDHSVRKFLLENNLLPRRNAVQEGDYVVPKHLLHKLQLTTLTTIENWMKSASSEELRAAAYAGINWMRFDACNAELQMQLLTSARLLLELSHGGRKSFEEVLELFMHPNELKRWFQFYIEIIREPQFQFYPNTPLRYPLETLIRSGMDSATFLSLENEQQLWTLRHYRQIDRLLSLGCPLETLWKIAKWPLEFICNRSFCLTEELVKRRIPLENLNHLTRDQLKLIYFEATDVFGYVSDHAGLSGDPLGTLPRDDLIWLLDHQNDISQPADFPMRLYLPGRGIRRLNLRDYKEIRELQEICEILEGHGGKKRTAEEELQEKPASKRAKKE